MPIYDDTAANSMKPGRLVFAQAGRTQADSDGAPIADACTGLMPMVPSGGHENAAILGR